MQKVFISILVCTLCHTGNRPRDAVSRLHRCNVRVKKSHWEILGDSFRNFQSFLMESDDFAPRIF